MLIRKLALPIFDGRLRLFQKKHFPINVFKMMENIIHLKAISMCLVFIQPTLSDFLRTHLNSQTSGQLIKILAQ